MERIFYINSSLSYGKFLCNLCRYDDSDDSDDVDDGDDGVGNYSYRDVVGWLDR